MSWWLDELGHAGDEHLDAEYVAAYDRKAGFDPAEDVDVLKGHGLDDSTTLIDLGAGTGRFTLAVAPRCRRVIAVDVSPAMTAVLREAVDAAGGSTSSCAVSDLGGHALGVREGSRPGASWDGSRPDGGEALPRRDQLS